MPLWTITREWEGKDAFVIGGGSSLSKFDFTVLAGRHVIGCNDAFRLGSAVVELCVFGDASWWNKNKWEVEKFTGKVATCAPTLLALQLPWLLQLHRLRDGLHSGNTVGWNMSTGAAAVNVAVNLGASRVFLLGFDMAQLQGKTHWHNHQFRPPNLDAFKRHVRGFYTLENSLKRLPHVSVFNVTNGESQLPVFPRVTFAEFRERINNECH